MQKYQDVVLDRNGNVVVGASVTVRTYPAGAVATIYSDNGITTVSNPLTTDVDGQFAFYAADARYTLEVSKTGYGTDTLTDILLEDPLSAAAVLGLGQVAYGHTGTGVITSSANLLFDGTTLTVATGNITTGSAASLSLMTTGGTQFVVANTASAVNYLQVSGAAAGLAPHVIVAGSDTNIPLVFVTKGIGAHYFYTASETALQFLVAHTASAVNYLQVTGAATGTPVDIRSQGSDTNIAMEFVTKGIGSFLFFTNSGSPQFLVVHTASAVNYIQVTGSASGLPILSSQGTSTDVNIKYEAKGAGYHHFASLTGSSVALFQCGNASISASFVSTGGTLAYIGDGASIVAGGGATQFGIYVSNNQSFLIVTGASGVRQFVVAHTTSAVNYFEVTGGATATAVVVSATGTDTDVGLNVRTKGAGSMFFQSHAGSNNQFVITATASTVNYLQVTGAASGANPRIQASGENLLLGSGSALATTATAGYVMLPSCAGTPTGVPTAQGAGKIPMQFDTTGVKLWFYTGGSWKGVVVA